MIFKLEVLIDAADLRTILQAAENVVLAELTASGQPSVAWLDFSPFQANTLEWEEQYGLYASGTSLQQGATIEMLSSVAPVAERSVYALDVDQAFQGPLGQKAPAGSYGVENKVPPSKFPALTFGLTQAVVVNGANFPYMPINASLVPAHQEATFKPLTALYVWLDDTIRGGTVLQSPDVLKHVRSRWTKVVFGEGVVEQTLRYDPLEGQFVIVS